MSKRAVWSVDGTIGYRIDSSTLGRTLMTEANRQSLDDAPSGSTASYGMASNNNQQIIALNFPSSFTADKIGLAMAGATTFYVQTSTNSTDGLDGTWTTVRTSSETLGGYGYSEFTLTATAGTWLRVRFTESTWNVPMRTLIVFGEYDAPNFEFWDASGAAGSELSDNYQTLASAPNNTTYSDYIAFTLKNTDASTHSYTVTVAPQKYGGDSVISTYFSLSDNAGSSKGASLTITDLAAGAFTGELRLYGDMTSEQNPADGIHFGYVKVEETA